VILNRSLLCLASVFLLASGCSYMIGDSIPVSPKPVIVESLADYNLVLITVDALRPDHLGCYGDSSIETPAIDSLATNGLLFTDAYANSSFPSQSMSTLLSSRLPTSGGTIDILGSHPHDATPTLSQHFLKSGRATALVGNQPLLKSKGFTKGYEDVSVGTGRSSKTASEVTEDALMFVEDVAGDSFFLHVHFAEPHEPYGDADSPITVRGVREDFDVIAADDGMRSAAITALKQRYDAEVAAVDSAVQQLLDGLAERGVSERTAIVFTATHGEEFWDHGYVGHAWTLYDEVLRVPLILHAPGRVPAAIGNSTVSLADVLPSLQTLFELEEGTDPVYGTSAFSSDGDKHPYLGESSTVIADLVLRDRVVLRAVINDGWKYIAAQHWPDPSVRNALLANPLDLWADPERELLFNLREDPDELHDLSATATDQIAFLRDILGQYRSYCEEHGVPPRELTGEMEIGDTDDRESLETLGYL